MNKKSKPKIYVYSPCKGGSTALTISFWHNPEVFIVKEPHKLKFLSEKIQNFDLPKLPENLSQYFIKQTTGTLPPITKTRLFASDVNLKDFAENNWLIFPLRSPVEMANSWKNLYYQGLKGWGDKDGKFYLEYFNESVEEVFSLLKNLNKFIGTRVFPLPMTVFETPQISELIIKFFCDKFELEYNRNMVYWDYSIGDPELANSPRFLDEMVLWEKFSPEGKKDRQILHKTINNNKTLVYTGYPDKIYLSQEEVEKLNNIFENDYKNLYINTANAIWGNLIKSNNCLLNTSSKI